MVIIGIVDGKNQIYSSNGVVFFTKLKLFFYHSFYKIWMLFILALHKWRSFYYGPAGVDFIMGEARGWGAYIFSGVLCTLLYDILYSSPYISTVSTEEVVRHLKYVHPIFLGFFVFVCEILQNCVVNINFCLFYHLQWQNDAPYFVCINFITYWCLSSLFHEWKKEAAKLD